MTTSPCGLSVLVSVTLYSICCSSARNVRDSCGSYPLARNRRRNSGRPLDVDVGLQSALVGEDRVVLGPDHDARFGVGGAELNARVVDRLVGLGVADLVPRATATV